MLGPVQKNIFGRFSGFSWGCLLMLTITGIAQAAPPFLALQNTRDGSYTPKDFLETISQVKVDDPNIFIFLENDAFPLIAYEEFSLSDEDQYASEDIFQVPSFLKSPGYYASTIGEHLFIEGDFIEEKWLLDLTTASTQEIHLYHPSRITALTLPEQKEFQTHDLKKDAYQYKLENDLLTESYIATERLWDEKTDDLIQSVYKYLGYRAKQTYILEYCRTSSKIFDEFEESLVGASSLLNRNFSSLAVAESPLSRVPGFALTADQDTASGALFYTTKRTRRPHFVAQQLSQKAFKELPDGKLAKQLAYTPLILPFELIEFQLDREEYPNYSVGSTLWTKDMLQSYIYYRDGYYVDSLVRGKYPLCAHYYGDADLSMFLSASIEKANATLLETYDNPLAMWSISLDEAFVREKLVSTLYIEIPEIKNSIFHVTPKYSPGCYEEVSSFGNQQKILTNILQVEEDLTMLLLRNAPLAHELFTSSTRDFGNHFSIKNILTQNTALLHDDLQKYSPEFLDATENLPENTTYVIWETHSIQAPLSLNRMEVKAFETFSGTPLSLDTFLATASDTSNKTLLSHRFHLAEIQLHSMEELHKPYNIPNHEPLHIAEWENREYRLQTDTFDPNLKVALFEGIKHNQATFKRSLTPLISLLESREVPDLSLRIFVEKTKAPTSIHLSRESYAKSRGEVLAHYLENLIDVPYAPNHEMSFEKHLLNTPAFHSVDSLTCVALAIEPNYHMQTTPAGWPQGIIYEKVSRYIQCHIPGSSRLPTCDRAEPVTVSLPKITTKPAFSQFTLEAPAIGRRAILYPISDKDSDVFQSLRVRPLTPRHVVNLDINRSIDSYLIVLNHDVSLPDIASPYFGVSYADSNPALIEHSLTKRVVLQKHEGLSAGDLYKEYDSLILVKGHMHQFGVDYREGIHMIEDYLPSSFTSVVEDAKLRNRTYRCTGYNLARIPSLADLNTENASDDFDVQYQIIPRMTDQGYIFSVNLSSKDSVRRVAPKHNVYFLIDRSSSIERHRFETFKNAVANAISYLDEDNAFNVIMFDNHIEQLSHIDLRPTRASVRVARDFLDRQDQSWLSSNKSMIEVLRAILYRANESNELYSVVLLTDGSNLKSIDASADALKQLMRNPKENFAIHTAAISDKNNIPMLDLLAGLNRGQFLYSHTHAAFPRKLAILTKHIKKPIVTDLHITVADSREGSIQFHHSPRLSQHLAEKCTYSFLGTVPSLQTFDVLIQGKVGNRWVNIRKHVNLDSAKRGRSKIEQQLALLLAYEKYEHYLETKDRQALTEAETILKPFGIFLPF